MDIVGSVVLVGEVGWRAVVMEQSTCSRGWVVMLQCGKREGREREGTELGLARREGVLRS